MKILFLDDMPERIPKLRPNEEVVYVRSFSEFTNWLSTNKLPDIISFDHDLSDVHYFGKNYDPKDYPTGVECAKWAVKNGYIPKYVIVHSWNPAGAIAIANCFNEAIEDDKVLQIVIRPFNPNVFHV